MPRSPRTTKSEKPYKVEANLDVLLGEEKASTSPVTVKLANLCLPKSQPRRYFDPQKLEQLTESIKAHGILENLLVRPVEGQDNSYELVAGERRYRAAVAAGLEEIPVTIRSLTDSQALEISLVENLQREDLNPVEETEAILQLLSSRLQIPVTEVNSLLYQMLNLKSGKITNNVISNSQTQAVQQVFLELGLMGWESFIINRLPLLKLPEEILEALRQGKLEYTKAKAIASLKNSEARNSLLAESIENNLSLSQIRERIKDLTSSVKSDSEPKNQIQNLSRRLNQSKLWSKDPKQWKRIQGWLAKIEALLDSANLPDAVDSSVDSSGESEPEIELESESAMTEES